ncbi:unnamed protein product [Adineta steineri]|uniref:Uncharacterized protein n=1 Tax=Adineta steineri TaxID=433720 RepID=A0A816A785_9BILA|nr:unnamed protein product [Adineta steineri]CAF1592228.1 unnamed protein product [Adineta steineri]
MATVVKTNSYQRRLPRTNSQIANSTTRVYLPFAEYLASFDPQSMSSSVLTTSTNNYHNTNTSSTLKIDIITSNTTSSLLNSTTLYNIQKRYIWKYVLYFTFFCILLIVLRILIRHLSACYRTFRVEKYHKKLQDDSTSLDYLTVPTDTGIHKNNNNSENDNSYVAFASNQISLGGSVITLFPDYI